MASRHIMSSLAPSNIQSSICRRHFICLTISTELDGQLMFYVRRVYFWQNMWRCIEIDCSIKWLTTSLLILFAAWSGTSLDFESDNKNHLIFVYGFVIFLRFLLNSDLGLITGRPQEKQRVRRRKEGKEY